MRVRDALRSSDLTQVRFHERHRATPSAHLLRQLDDVDLSEVGQRLLELLSITHEEHDQPIGMQVLSCRRLDVVEGQILNRLNVPLGSVERPALPLQLDKPLHDRGLRVVVEHSLVQVRVQ